MKQYKQRYTNETPGAKLFKPRSKPTTRQKKIDKARMEFLEKNQEKPSITLAYLLKKLIRK